MYILPMLCSIALYRTVLYALHCVHCIASANCKVPSHRRFSLLFSYLSSGTALIYPVSSSFQSSSVLGGTFGFEMPGKQFRAALVCSIQNSNILLTGT
ncbi:hypothetical protein DL95DRAFT_394083 [Leptodontidium sp. 2 PMI_412]|nr:hypothetical protein DL95DRAFT_394083 [Leptodontidium sp. 2 PMI_412]